jgi:hypothetical protein
MLYSIDASLRTGHIRREAIRSLALTVDRPPSTPMVTWRRRYRWPRRTRSSA